MKLGKILQSCWIYQLSRLPIPPYLLPSSSEDKTYSAVGSTGVSGTAPSVSAGFASSSILHLLTL